MRLTLLATAVATLTLNAAMAQTTNPAPYCEAGFDDPTFAVDDQILSVSFGTLINASNSHYAAPHYVFYNNLPSVDFTKGSSYDLKLNFKVNGGCGYGVWIDYNRNNIFESNEKVAGTTGTAILDLSANTVVNKSIVIPTTAMTGKTRMRVRIVEDDNSIMTSTDILPCNLSSSSTDVMDWGETEDYEINLIGGTSIEGINGEAHITVFPNPSTGEFTVKSTAGIQQLEVVDLLGATILSQFFRNENEVSLNHNFAPGMYVLRLTSAKGVWNKTIQIAK